MQQAVSNTLQNPGVTLRAAHHRFCSIHDRNQSPQTQLCVCGVICICCDENGRRRADNAIWVDSLRPVSSLDVPESEPQRQRLLKW